ncbi:MAG: hypothetical protein ACI4WR_08225 [Bulleidia sp.]
MLTRTGHEPLREDREAAARALAAADQELRGHSELGSREADLLKACWVQKNSIDSAAVKLGMRRETVQMWYYRFAMAEVREAIRECHAG